MFLSRMKIMYICQDLIVRNGEEWLVTGENPTTNPTTKSAPTMQVNRLLEVMGDGEYSSSQLRTMVGLKDKKYFTEKYLNPAVESGLVVMTYPEQKNHRNQRYRKA